MTASRADRPTPACDRPTSPGWGRYAPSQVLTNADLEKMVDTSDEWIRIADRHPRAARRRRPRDDRLDGRGRRPAGDRRRRPPAGRHRPHPRRHAHARLLDAVDRGPRQGGHRQHAGGGDGRRGRLLGLRVRLRLGPRPRHERHGQPRARHRRRDAHPVPRLHRSQHVHPVRRRGRGGRPVGLGRARRRPGHRADDRARRRLHDLAARRRREGAVVARHDRPRRAPHPDGGQGDLPVRDPDPGLDRARRGREGRPDRRPTSTCSSRTRPTSGSSRRWPRASTCRWRRCSSTSTATATRPRRRSRSRSPRRSTAAGSRSATTSSSSPSGPASRAAPWPSSGPPTRPGRSASTSASGPRTSTSGRRSTGTRSTRSRPPSRRSWRRPVGGREIDLDDVAPGEPARASHQEVPA